MFFAEMLSQESNELPKDLLVPAVGAVGGRVSGDCLKMLCEVVHDLVGQCLDVRAHNFVIVHLRVVGGDGFRHQTEHGVEPIALLLIELKRNEFFE